MGMFRLNLPPGQIVCVPSVNGRRVPSSGSVEVVLWLHGVKVLQLRGVKQVNSTNQPCTNCTVLYLMFLFVMFGLKVFFNVKRIIEETVL